MRVLAACQLLGTFYTHWSRLEELKEERLRREQDLRKEESSLEAKLAAFQATLQAQVGAEISRSQSFIAAMQAVSVAQDPAVTHQILEMAHELLARPLVIPEPAMEGRF
jgi:hypothetical protein